MTGVAFKINQISNPSYRHPSFGAPPLPVQVVHPLFPVKRLLSLTSLSRGREDGGGGGGGGGCLMGHSIEVCVTSSWYTMNTTNKYALKISFLIFLIIIIHEINKLLMFFSFSITELILLVFFLWRNSFYRHGGHGSREQPIRQPKAGNMVYRPPSSHLPSLSGHKPQNETSEVFIKKEPGSKRLTYSQPQPCITTILSHKASQAVTLSHKSPPSTISLHRASASSSLAALSKVTQQGGESASSSHQDA